MGSRSCFLVWGLRLFLSVCLFGFAPRCDAGNILVYPFDGSHWVNLKVQLEELHARGHKLTVIRSNSSWYINERSHLYSSITIPSQTNFEEHLGGILEKQLKAQLEGASPLTFSSNSFLSVMMKIHEIWLEDFIYILNNANIIKELRDAKYDLMLTDPDVAPGVILAKYLNLPLVLNVRWALIVDGQFLVAPSPLSYIPLPGSGFTEKMDYFQRVQNMFLYIMSSIHMYFIASRYKPICEKYIEGGCDIVSLLQDADIWLFRTDFVFDFPRPTMPNVIYIGGFQCKPAQPLPAELEDFVQSAGEHGVIVMTLGSVVNAMPLELTSEIASVFAKLPQKVIWKHTGSRPSTLGNNTLIVDWIPQKDLLGHPQTKVFVAHGGTNGVQEAIYHGVPMLGIPLFFDQFDNLLRVQARGAGKIITLSDLNGVSFEQGLREVLHQQHYRDNMQRLSRLHKDQPMTPMDRAVFWVEFVIRHKGAPHLRTQAYKMPWYSYYCVDVLLLLLTVVIGAVLGVVSVFRLLCCRSRTKMKQQ